MNINKQYKLLANIDENGTEETWYIKVKKSLFIFGWSSQQGVLYFNKEVALLALASLNKNGRTS